MKQLFLLLLVLATANASKILSYNVYDRSDRVDVMFTFDTPYEGTIRQNRQQNRIVIKLSDAEIESPKVKEVHSKFVSKFTITPIDSQTQMIANVPTDVVMQASKTSDAYGLRLRFVKQKSVLSKPQAPKVDENPLANLPTKPNTQLSTSYYLVIGILLVGIVVMLWFKKRAAGSSSRGVSKPWLFSNKKAQEEDVSIRFQKNIDQQNRVVMLEYGEESYLMVIGNSNVVLDKFHANQIVSQNEFDSMLQSKHEELDSFLQLDKQEENPLQNYKDKASGIDYRVD